MTMAALNSPEIERRALALFEHLADSEANTKLRARMLKNESAAVLARLAALEASAKLAEGAIPTLIPGSADCGDVTPPPERVGPFRLITRIGRGGMGDVWSAVRDDGLYEQKVAVKLIQRHALVRAGEAFNDERRFLARLEHPNIARLIDGGVTEDGLPYLVLEFIEGQPIDLACATLPDKARVNLFIKAADAAQYAHSKLVAHADLKPGNIIVDASGRVKLLDFGIASLIGEGARSPTGSGPLTREFASPQRIAGAGPSVADDIFALGKTLRLMLNASEDVELSAIAAKACHTDEAERYTSAAAFIADLDRWRMQLPVTAIPDGWRYRAGKFVDRHRFGVIATGAALILLSATSLIATSNYFRAERTRVKAEQRFSDVRNLSRYMLYDLYDQLARQPGTVAKRAEIARTVSNYLERLQLSDDSPVGLRLETARSYRRLAAIQGYPATSNLGQSAQAGNSLDRAEALLNAVLSQQPGNADALAERGWVKADRWTMAAFDKQSSKLTNAAALDFDKALVLAPGNALARLGRIEVQEAKSFDLVMVANKPAEATPVARAALIELRAARWPISLMATAQRIEISLLNTTGDALYYAGNVPGALVPYREGERLIDQAIAATGSTPNLLIAKAFEAFNISGTLGDMGGHYAESLAVARQGAASMERLLQAGRDSSAQKMLLILYGQEAVDLENMGRISEAIGQATAANTLRERRLAASPGDPQAMRDLAIGLTQQGRLLGLAGRNREACATAKRTLALWNSLKAHGSLGAFDVSREVPKADALKRSFCGT